MRCMCVGVLYLNNKSWKKHVAMLIMPTSHAKAAVRAVRDMLLLPCMTFFVSPCFALRCMVAGAGHN